MKKHICAATVLCLVTATNIQAQATSTTMRVARHAAVTTIPSATWDAAFTQATNAFQTDNGMLDLPCDLALVRLGGSFWFSGGGCDSYPNTEAQYDACIDNATDAYVNVVNSVDWCGGTGTWGGCTYIGSRVPFLINRERATSAANGIVIAHEFGHSLDVLPGAANGHDNQGRQIMDGALLQSNMNMVRQPTTCTRFRYDFGPTCPPPSDISGTDPAICSSTTDFAPRRTVESAALARADAEDVDYTNVTIEEVANAGILDSIPTVLDTFYGRSDVDYLKKRLAEDREGDRRSVPALIGLISDGDPSDVETLLQYSERPNADVSAALMSVGYIITRTKKDFGIDQLIKKLNADEVRVYSAAALGLSISGSPRALEALEARAPQQFDPYNVLSTAPEENRVMASLGFRGYYEEASKRLAGGPRFKALPGGTAGQDDER